MPRILALAVTLGAVLVRAAAAEPPPPDPASDEPALDPGGADPADTDPPKFDPLAGMDEDGRIPKPDLPPDLPNPDRWRYIPEGRLHPGNILQRVLVSSFPIPTFFFSSDVGAGFGLAFVDIDFREQRRQEFARIAASYTTEGQQNYKINWKRWLHHIEHPDGGVLQEERSFIKASGGYTRTLTRRFFGRGRNANTDTNYTDERVTAELSLDYALPEPGGNWILSGGFRMTLHDLSGGASEDKPDPDDLQPVLDMNGDPVLDPMGNPVLEPCCFPKMFDRDKNAKLGWILAEIAYDTRDSQANPYVGTQIRLTAGGAVLQQGLDKTGGRFALITSHVLKVPGLFHDGGDPDEEHPPTDTLAFSFVNRTSVGDLPFFELPTLGGDNRIRGDVNGRWRDTAIWSASAEYRLWWLPRGFAITDSIRVERLGLALFVDVGGVAQDWLNLFTSRVVYSVGPSLRISLERGAPFRVDFGWSQDDMNITATFGLPF